MKNVVSQMIHSLLGNKSEEKPCEISIHMAHEFLKCLGKEHLTKQDLQAVIESPGNERAREIVELIHNGLYEPSPDQNAAKEIMGNNYFGVEDVIKYLKVRPTRKQLAELADIPYSMKTLQELKESHMLVAVFPMSLTEMFNNKLFRSIFVKDYKEKEKQPFKGQQFTLDPGKIGWSLVRKSPEKDSPNKVWIAQLQILGKDNRTTSVRIMAYSVLCYFLKTGHKLFSDCQVRCIEEDASGRRLTVGPFRESEEGRNNGGLRIECWWDDNRCDFVGLSSVRKPDEIVP